MVSQEPLAVRVQCYAGHRGEEIPQAFFLGSRRVGVDEVLDRWLAPDHRYFKVRGDEGGIYILRYDPARDSWSLTLYDSGNRPETRLSST